LFIKLEYLLPSASKHTISLKIHKVMIIFHPIELIFFILSEAALPNELHKMQFSRLNKKYCCLAFKLMLLRIILIFQCHA